MNKFFKKYQQFSGVAILLWLFLELAGKFGLDFRLDLHLFTQVIGLLVLLYLGGEIKIHWRPISRLISNFFLEKKREVIVYTSEVQSRIVKPQSRILQSKMGFRVTFLVALIYSLMIFFKRSLTLLFKNYIFSKSALLSLVILGILADILAFKQSSDFYILVFSCLGIWSIKRFRFEGRVSVMAALIFLTFCPFLLIFKQEPMAEKFAVWAYIFLAFGVAQIFIEFLKEEKAAKQG